MNQTRPAGVIDLITKQKTNWAIRKLIKMLESSEGLKHPVNM